MVASTSIKYFVHTNTNAPQLNNVQGSMIAVLDACLVNGLTLGAVNSMTATGTTVTINFGSAHNLLRFQVVKIAGAVQSEYNGEHRILSIPTISSITFEVATAPSVSPAAGIILASLPPLGWSLPFTGTGKRAYKNTDLEGPYLRVIDIADPAQDSTWAKWAKVGIVEDMSDIDTMLGQQAPFNGAAPNRNWVATGSGDSVINGWAKWFYATPATESQANVKNFAPTNGARAWVIVGDGETFYIFNKAHHSTNTNLIPHGFGKMGNLSKVNASAYFLSAKDDYTSASTSISASGSALSTTSFGNGGKVFFLKNHKGESVYSTGVAKVFNGGTNDYTGASETYKQPGSEVSVFRSDYIFVENENIPRGSVPILRWLHQLKPYSHLENISDNQTMLVAINCMCNFLYGQIIAELGEI